jgi:hypothetical protein
MVRGHIWANSKHGGKSGLNGEFVKCTIRVVGKINLCIRACLHTRSTNIYFVTRLYSVHAHPHVQARRL